jgi:hypothetical protein
MTSARPEGVVSPTSQRTSSRRRAPHETQQTIDEIDGHAPVLVEIGRLSEDARKTWRERCSLRPVDRRHERALTYVVCNDQVRKVERIGADVDELDPLLSKVGSQGIDHHLVDAQVTGAGRARQEPARLAGCSAGGAGVIAVSRSPTCGTSRAVSPDTATFCRRATRRASSCGSPRGSSASCRFSSRSSSAAGSSPGRASCRHTTPPGGGATARSSGVTGPGRSRAANVRGTTTGRRRCSPGGGGLVSAAPRGLPARSSIAGNARARRAATAARVLSGVPGGICAAPGGRVARVPRAAIAVGPAVSGTIETPGTRIDVGRAGVREALAQARSATSPCSVLRVGVFPCAGGERGGGNPRITAEGEAARREHRHRPKDEAR